MLEDTDLIVLLFICYFVFSQERLAHLKRQCQPHLTEAVKSSVEGICTKIYNQSCESVKKIAEKHWGILKEYGISCKCTKYHLIIWLFWRMDSIKY